MKKRIFRILAVVLLVCFGMTAIMACNPEKEPGPDTTDYTVTYVGGEGATGEAPAAETHKAGENFKLKANPFTKKGFAFTKWNDGTNNYSAGATYKMPAKNVVFTAQWEETEMVTVTYSLGEYTTGTAPTANTVEKGGEVTLADAPAWEGYDFLGWRVGTDLKNAGDKITVTANITVTAEWEKHTPPMDGTWTASEVDGALFGADGKISLEVAVKKEGLGVYAVLRITGGDTVHTQGILFDGATEGWASQNITLKIAEDGSKLTVGGLGQSQDKTVDLTGRTDFTGDEYTLEGAYNTTADEKTVYVDFSYGAIDRGEGLLEDAEFVSVGKYVITFVETTGGEDVYLTGLYVFEAEGESVVSYSQGSKLTFTATTARAKKISFTSLKLEEDEGKVYLIGSGTYEGYTTSDMLALMEGHDDDDVQIETESGGKTGSGFNLSFYCKDHRDYEADWKNVENTAKGGLFTSKLDITNLNIEQYGILGNNSGYGDLMLPAETNEKAVLGDKFFTIIGSAGSKAILVVGDSTTDWTGVSATPTSITMALNDGGDKVLLTVSGTYSGTTADHMKVLLSQKYNTFDIIYFWGSDNGTQAGKDIAITTTDDTWSIQLDITDLKEDLYENVDGKGNLVAEGTVVQNATPGDGINGRENTSPGTDTEFRVASVVDTTVKLGEKVYTLVASGLYGHNTIYVGTGVTLTYSLGDWEEGTAPAKFEAAKSSHIVLAEAPKRDGYLFKGWKTGVNDKGDVIQQPGERVELKSDTTVTAQWKKWPQPRTDYVGKWTGKVDGTAVGAAAGECDVEIDVLATDEGATLVVRATASEKVLVSSALYIPAHDRAYALGNITLELVDGTLSLANFVDGKTISLTSKTTFNKEDEITVTGVYTAAEGAIYLDVDYGAIDMGEGYLDDADYVNIDRFLVPLVEVEGALQGMLVLEKEGDALIAYGPEGMKLEFAEGTKRAQVFGADKDRPCTTWTFDLKKETVDEEGTEKVYLVVSGTYEGYTPSDLKKLLEDNVIATCSVSIYPNHEPWKPIFPNPQEGQNLIERTHVVGEGKFTAKLDITEVPYDTYGIASQNNGYGDLGWGANTQKEVTLGETRYIVGANGVNAQLSIGKAVDVVANSVTLGLDNDETPTKVLLTIKGTYVNITKAEVEEIFKSATIISFWGSKGQQATCTSTVEDDGTWTIVVDITNLEDDNDMAIIAGYNGPHKLNDRGGTEFHFDWVKDASVTFNNKVYSLKKAQAGWPGHNCVSVKPVAAE